jgi:hypothetical protein
MAGYDFVIPHRTLTTFSVVVRVGDRGDSVSIAYSGCSKRDRGDEFDQAFAGNHEKQVVTLSQGDTFCDELEKSLVEYLERKLLLICNLRGNREIAAAQVFWPSATRSDEQVLLWQQRARFWRGVETTTVTRMVAFDESVRSDA